MKTESSSRRCSGNYGKCVKTEESTDTTIKVVHRDDLHNLKPKELATAKALLEHDYLSTTQVANIANVSWNTAENHSYLAGIGKDLI